MTLPDTAKATPTIPLFLGAAGGGMDDESKKERGFELGPGQIRGISTALDMSEVAILATCRLDEGCREGLVGTYVLVATRNSGDPRAELVLVFCGRSTTTLNARLAARWHVVPRLGDPYPGQPPGVPIQQWGLAVTIAPDWEP